MSGFISGSSGEILNGFLPYKKIIKKAQEIAHVIVIILQCEALT
jgi:hypothetical protein